MNKLIYTIGHSNRTWDEFISLLKHFEIQLLVDVRRYPGSQRFPHFDREYLKSGLEQQRLTYFWLGDLLGGFRTGGYEEYVQTTAYRKGVEKIMEIADRKVSTIFCAEKNYANCHRIHIADTLFDEGCQIIHILEETETIDHGDVVEKRRQTELSQLDLFNF
ncbi:DUF488 domain-containing protein [candidate division KSB1 bacterium]|nr:DUF488 domain-containing protein [candidate division KSB1 bacterium]